MEACASAHYWARELAALGHDTKLIPPAYVKPFVKPQKNDLPDAEAICEAAQRPTMRFVQGKSAQARASSVVFRTRDLLVRQRTQLINAVRGQCLGQRGDGELLLVDEDRTDRPEDISHAQSREGRRVRLHRALLQSHTQALDPGLTLPHGL
jgi:transposase